MHDSNDEVYLLFIEESQEHLADVEADLLELENQMESPSEELVNKLFRAVHTVKGGAGFFGLTPIQSLSHAMESVLGMVRAQTLSITEEMISVLLKGADVLSTMVNNPETIEDNDPSQLIELLRKIIDGDTSVNGSPDNLSEQTIDIALPGGETLFTVPLIDIQNAQNVDGGGNYIYLIKYDLFKDIEQRGRTPQQVVKEYLQLTYFIDSYTDYSQMGTLSDDNSDDELPFYVLCATVMDPLIMGEFAGVPNEQVALIFDKKITNDLVSPAVTDDNVEVVTETIPEPVETYREESSVTREQSTHESVAIVEDVVNVSQTSSGESREKKRAKEGSSSVRVSVHQLEVLMNLAGELVLTRNELMQKIQQVDLPDINDAAQKVDSITSELQEAIMVTRMQSVGIVFNKFRRIVRDLSGTLKKNVDLVIEGEDVELDRTIVEAIGDPLTHMIRNSVDHGIEMPDERVANGKSDTGTLFLTAMHKAGQVIISLRDDGKGIDPAIIGKSALSKGLVSEDQLNSMSKKDIIKLIFKPGFSTAQQVTDLSGRGVGMDVVLSSFTKVGGVVDIDSEPGQGTEITIKLPLTLAIIPSLLLRAGGERFAIPQVNIVELVRIRDEDRKERIEWVGDAAVLRLRGKLLPLIRLTDLLGMDAYFTHPETGETLLCRRDNIPDRRSPHLGEPVHDEGEGRTDRRNSSSSAVNIAVVATGSFSFGIIVDTLLDSEEIVVKPLGRHLKSCNYYAGATILGDGHVAMILDIAAIQEHAVITNTAERVDDHSKDKSIGVDTETQTLLIFKNNEHEQFAIPMVLVTRIEKVPVNEFISVGGKRAIQYRGDTLIILNLTDVTSVGALEEQQFYNVIVFKVNNREFGLQVGEVDDTIQFKGTIDGISYVQPGIMGTFIYQQQVFMLVDLFGMTKSLLPDIFEGTDLATESVESQTKTVLVVEDSQFFLHQIETLLKEDGYSVLLAENGEEGIALLKDHPEINIVLTDIEMPVMDGLEMTRRIREIEKYQNFPIVAITSLSGEDAEKGGMEAGVTEYLIKMDKEQILETCKRLLEPVGV